MQARELATRTDEVHQWKQRCRLLENQLTGGLLLWNSGARLC
jgi:hypothetical protein